MPDDNNDWRDHRLLVLNELRRLEENHSKVIESLSDIGDRFGKVEQQVGDLVKAVEKNFESDSHLNNSVHKIQTNCVEKSGEIKTEIKSLKVKVSIIASAIATAVAVGARFLF